MDISKLEAVIVGKVCPSCALGMVRETGCRVYTCNHSKCGAVFDFSPLTDGMIKMLLQKDKGSPQKNV